MCAEPSGPGCEQVSDTATKRKWTAGRLRAVSDTGTPTRRSEIPRRVPARRGQWRPLWRVSTLPPNSPDPPDRRTSEEAHLRGCCGVRGDRNRRAGCDGERGGCPERCVAAAGLVVLGDPECQRESAHRL